MGKSVTIYDVAKAAGVSAATVSYVINNRNDQTISEATKTKILQVANMLNYKPNVFAKSLRSNTSDLTIAICSESNTIIEKAEFYNFAQSFSKNVDAKHNLVMAFPPLDVITSVDAIVTFNISRDSFLSLASKHYVPLIAVNTHVHDELFFDINPDVNKMKMYADQKFNASYMFVSLELNDCELKQSILNTFQDVLFIRDLNELKEIYMYNVLTISESVREYCQLRNKNVVYYDVYSKICTTANRCINAALKHEALEMRSFKV